MKVFQKYMNSRARKDLVKDLGKYTGTYSFMKDRVISECSRVLLRPEIELENLFGRLTTLEVFIATLKNQECIGGTQTHPFVCLDSRFLDVPQNLF